MKYQINIQAGIEVLTYEVSSPDKRMAEIKAKYEAYLMTGSEYIKVLSINEVK